MKILPLSFLIIASIMTGPAFAADSSPQPLTRADCDKSGMAWNDNANVCGSELEVPSIPAAPGTIETATPGQPLTRADCGRAGMSWNDRANVCGPRSEGLKAQAAPKVESAAQAERAKPNAARVAKQRREKHAHIKKKYKYRRMPQPAQSVERRPFRLFRNLNRPAGAY